MFAESEMKFAIACILLILPSLAPGQTKPAEDAPHPSGWDDYQVGPDSQRHTDVPQGKTFQFKFDRSRIFPGTVRTISVYVPAQYKADKPACVYVGLDGLGFDAAIVFDNLIAKHEMPVTIAIGVSPGQVESAKAPADPRFNRSFEFDGLNDNLARLLLEEIFPEVENHKTPDDLPIRLSADPNDRCAGGGSTGGIGAFTLAWERPDAFRRVFTAIGTFVGMRGGDRYPVLIRKTEPKPIRVFMQDGSADEWMGGPEVGDWWMSNQTVARALEFSGYDVHHVWGTGPHSGRQAAALFPDAMRFLWKDWPKPIEAGESQNTFLKAVLERTERWQLVPGSYGYTSAIASTRDGAIWYHEDTSGTIHPLEGAVPGHEGTPQGESVYGFAFGPDGKDYTSRSSGQIKAEWERVADDVRLDCLAVTHAGVIYGCVSGEKDGAGALWLLTRDGKKTKLDEKLNHPAAVALSPDGLWLAVLESKSHWGYSYRVNDDGTVSDKQKFYWLHVPDTADDSGAAAACFDRDGRLYVATRMGIQVLDRNGRSRAILPLPMVDEPVNGVCFGGKDFDTLYACAGGKVYSRKMKSKGLAPAAAPIKLPPWGAG
jgi:enterochelin esterase-like enzyme